MQRVHLRIREALIVSPSRLINFEKSFGGSLVLDAFQGLLQGFLAPEGELIDRIVGLYVRLSWNELEKVDLHRHIIYQNDPLTKPDFILVFPDPYLRPCRRQGHRRLPRHHPEPQGPSYMAIINTKMILCDLVFSKIDRHF